MFSKSKETKQVENPVVAVDRGKPVKPVNQISICDRLELNTSAELQKAAFSKFFALKSNEECPSSSNPAKPVDLVILIDTSGSMNKEAKDLSDAADEAIKAAAKSCPSDLKVKWLGIGGTWAGTNFDTSYKNYLTNAGVNINDLLGKNGGTEDGAKAIIDTVKYFPWRPDADKAIFFLGDEAVDMGNPDDAVDKKMCKTAIETARTHNVKIFTYYGTEEGVYPDRDPDTIKCYQALASSTGGEFFQAPLTNLGGFQKVLQTIICTAGRGCAQADMPELKPCFVLTWGDGPLDHIETSDTEIFSILAWNPYSNVVIKNLQVMVASLIDPDGNRVVLPHQGDSPVWVKPSYMIGFGDLQPCDKKNPSPCLKTVLKEQKKPQQFHQRSQSSCVSREFVLHSERAKYGNYQLVLEFCFTVEYVQHGKNSFTLELLRS